ncbi:MAG: AMP-binding protein [Firmicutes bacterium]|nr:AMP-binding protein [Bacillota bacterium]
MNGYKSNYHLERKFREFSDMRDLIRESAGKYSEKVAYITKIKGPKKEVNYIKTTYKSLLRQVEELGTALLDYGLKGERVAVLGENSFHWCLAWLAVPCGVGVVVPLDKGLPEEELKSLISRSNAKAIFADSKYFDALERIKASGDTNLSMIFGLDKAPEGSLDVGEIMSRGAELLDGGDRSYIDAEIDREAMSYLLFTSGTTQAAKGVMLSHKNLMSVNYGMNLEEYFVPDDVCMLFLPLHHIFGSQGMVTFLSQGITCVFCDGIKYISANFKEYGVSVMMVVPLLLEKVYKKIMMGVVKEGKLETLEKGKKICAASEKVGIYIRRKVFKQIIDQLGGRMRFFISGAAPLDPVVAKGLNDLGILTVSGYGLTETAPTIASETYRYVKAGSVGKQLTNLEIRIDEPNEDGIGELVVKGDGVMLGYYDDKVSTDEVLEPDGWFHTGDLAYVDAEGYVFISGRKKNVIVLKNGKNVFPEEIEELVNRLPYVSESMLFARNKSDDLTLWLKVVYDQEYLDEYNMSVEDVGNKFAEDIEEINATMPSYKAVKRYFISGTPTIKTTTAKTKRSEEMKVIEEELKERNLI